jgi:hypothetical protein
MEQLKQNLIDGMSKKNLFNLSFFNRHLFADLVSHRFIFYNVRFF